MAALLPVLAQAAFGLCMLGLLCWLCAHPLPQYDGDGDRDGPSLGWRETEERAEALLAELLSAEERRRLERRGYLDVPSRRLPGRSYRIPMRQGTVLVYERGRSVMRLCLKPVVPMPDADVVLIHKLLIEGDEREYLRLAHHSPGIPLLWRLANGR